MNGAIGDTLAHWEDGGGMDMIRIWQARLMVHGDVMLEPGFFGRFAGWMIAVMLPLVFIGIFTLPVSVSTELIALVPMAIGMAFGAAMALRWAAGEIDRREEEAGGE